MVNSTFRSSSTLQKISAEVPEYQIGLDQIFESFPMLSTCGVQHKVDCSATFHQHIGRRLIWNEAL
jgi:hypothetical protein